MSLSSPARNWVTRAGRVKITKESSYFVSMRETSLPSCSTHVLFDFHRRSAPSLVIWHRSGKRGRKNSLVLCAILSQHLKEGSPLLLLREKRVKRLQFTLSSRESSNSQRIQQFNNAWKNYHLETAGCNLWFPKLFLALLTYFLIYESSWYH